MLPKPQKQFMQIRNPLATNTYISLAVSLMFLLASCTSNQQQAASPINNSNPIEVDTNTSSTTTIHKTDTTSALAALVPTPTATPTDKPLKYHWHESNDYSQAHLDSVYLLAEQYIKHSSNKLLTLARQANDQLEYSVEQRTQNEKTYDVLGIGHTFEHRFSIMQWIYIDAAQQQIWEYDLPNDTLVEFKIPNNLH